MKVLIADDDQFISQILKKLLTEWDYTPIIVHNGMSALRILSDEEPPQIVLLDWIMPGISGLEVCRKVRLQEKDQDNYTYIIMLTSRTNPEDLVEGMIAGADDYVRKPFNSQELKMRLHAANRIVELQQSLIETNKRLQDLASRDSMTGLLNHEEIINVLDQRLNHLTEEEKFVTVLMIDLDDFKRINDTHGHQIGDVVLTEIAQMLIQTTRSYDAVGRYGGEEFLVVLNNCDRSNGEVLAERIRDHIDKTPIQTEKVNIHTTVSIGVSSSSIAEMNAQQLIDTADIALYRAKSFGKNCVKSFGKIG